MSYYDHAALMALGLDPALSAPPAHLGRRPIRPPSRNRAGWLRRIGWAIGVGAARPAAGLTPAARRGCVGATREPDDAAAPGIS